MQMQMDMAQLQEWLPLLIPLVIAELALFVYALVHVLTHSRYKRGNRWLWLIVVVLGMEFIGPVLYLVLGKEES